MRNRTLVDLALKNGRACSKMRTVWRCYIGKFSARPMPPVKGQVLQNPKGKVPKGIFTAIRDPLLRRPTGDSRAGI